MVRYFTLMWISVVVSFFLLQGVAIAEEHNTKHTRFVILNESLGNLEFSRQQLRAIYLGQKTHWSDGNKITLIIFSPSQKSHQNFVKQTLGLNPYQFQRRWQKLEFSGFGVKPIEVSSADQMLERVASTPGAIGYLEEVKKVPGVRYATIK